MNTTSEIIINRYRLKSTDGKLNLLLPDKKRLMVGRGQTCDIHLQVVDISVIHAIIEIGENSFQVFDMNSTNGTFVNGKKVVSAKFTLSDTIAFGSSEFKLSKTKDSKSDTDFAGEHSSIIAYPLAKDSRVQYSEYIFEDSGEVYPIFNYQVNKQAVEVIIINKDKIYSVDYLPYAKKGIYYLAGIKHNDLEIMYGILGKEDKVPFIEIKNNDVFVNQVMDHKIIKIGDKGKEEFHSSVYLGTSDIICLSKKDLKIYVRGSEAPPLVKAAPLLTKDKELKKYLSLVLLFFTVGLAATFMVDVDALREKKEEEKIPERVARVVLYKQTVIPTPAIAKTEEAPKRVQESPIQEPPPEKPEPKPVPVEAPKPVEKPAEKIVPVETPKPVARPAPAPKAQARKVTPKPQAKAGAQAKGATPKKTPSPPRKAAPTKAASNVNKAAVSPAPNAKGPIETYQNPDFSGSVSSLLAKGSQVKAAAAATGGMEGATGSGSVGSDVGIGGSASSSGVTRSSVTDSVGSFAGNGRGNSLDATSGTAGIAKKSESYTIGIPGSTVLLGSMDPDLIHKILTDNLARFRSCYQDALNRSTNSFNGVIPIAFTIGPSGGVPNAGIRYKVNNIPPAVQTCVLGVIKSIKFPAPQGGGTVDVNQDLNLFNS